MITHVRTRSIKRSDLFKREQNVRNINNAILTKPSQHWVLILKNHFALAVLKIWVLLSMS
jgi:hypothetical protein